MNLFDILKDISYRKKYNFPGKGYPDYMINRYLSMNKETIFFANEMNKLHPPKQMQYDFYFYTLPKHNRFFKYFKFKKDNEAIEYICKYFNINKEQANIYMKHLSENNIKQIIKSFDKGGLVK